MWASLLWTSSEGAEAKTLSRTTERLKVKLSISHSTTLHTSTHSAHLLSEGLSESFCKHIVHVLTSEGLFKYFIEVLRVEIHATTPLWPLSSKSVVMSSLVLITKTRVRSAYFFKSIFCPWRFIFVGMHFNRKLNSLLKNFYQLTFL
jgi:hypothetical protein